jgi:hypothetical protein
MIIFKKFHRTISLYHFSFRACDWLQRGQLGVYPGGARFAPSLDPWHPQEPFADSYPPPRRLLIDENLNVEPPDVEGSSGERYCDSQADPPVGCDCHRTAASFMIRIVNKGCGKEILRQK